MIKKIALVSLIGGVVSCMIAKFNDTLHNHQYTRKDYTKKFINGYLISFIVLFTYLKFINKKQINSSNIHSQQGGLINNQSKNIIKNHETTNTNTSNFDYFKPKIEKSKLDFRNGTPNF